MVWCLRGFYNCAKHILTTYNFFGHSFCKPCHVWSNIPGFTVISKISKIRELSGNLKNSLIFTKNQGIVREFGTASGIFHCNQGIFIDESALFVFEYDTWKCSPDLGWLWLPLSLNLYGKWLSFESLSSSIINLLESPCIWWKLELCLKYFLLLE